MPDRIVYAADWVVPVEGAPVRDGGVAVEDGRILAVGPAADLEGERRTFADAVIVPAFVNAHSHLEYAVYAGFGDGFSFPPWIDLHVTRKRRLLEGDAVEIARLGAAECLRSGIATIGDASFTGAAAPACAELGLAGIVYLEVFGDDPEAARARFAELADAVSEHLSDRLRVGVSPHAPYTTSADVYEACAGLGVPVTTHLAESEAEQEWLLHGTGSMEAAAPLLVPPPGQTGIRLLAERGLLGSDVLAAHCVHVDAEEIALLAEHDVAVAHCPRSNAMLGCGAAPLADLLAAGGRVGAWHRQPRIDALVRHVRGDAHGRLHGARTRGAARRPLGHLGPGTRYSWRSARARARRRDGLARRRKARRPRPSSRWPARRSSPGRSQPPPWSSAARPTGSA